MAKLANSRPGSRQSQQDAPVTRATRSGSRQPSEPPSPQKARGAAAKKGGKKAKAVVNTADADLTTVNEDADLEEQLRQAMVPGEDMAATIDDAPAIETYDTRRASVVSGVSGFSGTTAQTSFSQEEIGELDPDIMVDILPALSSAADELAKLLVPADARAHPIMRKEINIAGSKFNKLYNNRNKAIDLHKNGFGSTGYIQPSIVLRALLGVGEMRNVPQGPWRPDNIIYKINLSLMLRAVLILTTSHGSDQFGYRALEDLDVHFASAIAGPVFSERAFRYCVSLLRQLTILRLTVYRPDRNFNPREQIIKAFYTEDKDGDHTFRHGEVLQMIDLPVQQMNEYGNFLQMAASEFIDLFDLQASATWDATIDELKAMYPWEDFTDETVEYYIHRNQELEQQIAAAGGIAQIASRLAEEVERRAAARASEAKRASFARPAATPRESFGSAANLKRLKERKQRLQQEANDVAAGKAAAALAMPPPTAPVAQMTDPALTEQAAPMDDGFQVHVAVVPEPVKPVESVDPEEHSYIQSLASFKPTQQGAAIRERPPSLLDRQPNAHRVEFESQSADSTVTPALQYPTAPVASQGPYYSSPGRASNKRPHAAIDEGELEEFDPTQDQGFETMERDTAAADERRRQAPQPKRPQHAHPTNIASSAPSTSRTTDFARASPDPANTQRRNPGSSIPNPLPPFDPAADGLIPRAADYEIVKIQARHATVRASQAKPAQARTPWEKFEENALIDLIMEHCEDGISYSTLKSLDNTRPEGPLLGRRSQEDMRFKARNMKVNFLKARVDMPANLKFVVLDRKAIVQLQNHGVDYDQERIRGNAANVLQVNE